MSVALGTSLRRGALAGAAVLGALLAYAHLIEPRWLRVSRWTVRIPELPPAWEGLRAVHLTDFHVGSPLQSRRLGPRAVAKALALEPDVVFLTGDYMHRGRWSPRGEFFAPLARRAPTYAVLGNHDHLASEADAAAIAGALRAQGVTVLQNEHAEFRRDGVAWTVVGIDDFATGHADLLAAVTGIARGTKLLALLTHVPDAADHSPHGWFPLTVAGHTHGAQIRLSPLERFDWIRLRFARVYSKYPRGWFAVRGGLLYVNRGLGMSDVPLRFAAAPEVALFVLTDGRALDPIERWRSGEPSPATD